MIDKIKEYTDDAVDFAAPYIQSAHKKAAENDKFRSEEHTSELQSPQ